MLSARKLHLAAGLKVHGLDLRKAELDFYMLRYITVAGISSIETGLSYVGIIKIKIPPELQPPQHRAWQVAMFYVCACLTMACALFNLCVSSFLVVNAQGLTLRGPPNSVARCVAILRSQWFSTKIALGLSLLFLLLAAVAIDWMKLHALPSVGAAIGCTALVSVVGTAALWRMARIAYEMRIDDDMLVEGDLTIGQKNVLVDILSEDQSVISVSRS
jgi:hypothetical protein